MQERGRKGSLQSYNKEKGTLALLIACKGGLAAGGLCFLVGQAPLKKSPQVHIMPVSPTENSAEA